MTVQQATPPPTPHHAPARAGHVPQLRLHGQAAAPEGPVDMTMMYLSHHAFRRDLRTFAAVVPATPVEDLRAWRAMLARWDVFSMVLHGHHAGEDEWLWPALLEVADAEEQRTLRAMEAEHAGIDPALAACRAGLATLADGGTAAARDRLAGEMLAARTALGQHLDHEETESIALIQRSMTQADWEEVDRHFQEKVTLSFALRAVPWILHEVPDAVREHVFAQPGGQGYRVVWALTRRRFARQHARAFAHLPRS